MATCPGILPERTYFSADSTLPDMAANIPLIQIAGVIDQPEADLLCRIGVPLLGFPLRLPVNQEDLSETDAADIIKGLSAPHEAVLITYLDRAEEILIFCKELGVSWVQLHGDISKGELSKLRTQQPDLKVIKSLVVRAGNRDVLRETVQALQDVSDYFITDTYDPDTGATGATGKTHDWAISRELVELSAKPVILAGGLNAGNVREAILTVGPAGVDAHTGVEADNGRKDPDQVREFIREAEIAFATLAQSKA